MDDRLGPMVCALNHMKEVAEDLQGLMDAVIRYANSDEVKCERIQRKSQSNNGKRKIIEDLDENTRSGSRNQESFAKPDKRTQIHDSEKTLQEPWPKHSRPG